jgi:hypothetical protein
MFRWSVAEPQKLVFDDPVTNLHVRIVHGMVNVVGTDESAPHLHVSEIAGPPLIVTQEHGTLTVAYEGLPWNGFLKWVSRKSWQRSAVVSLAVPVGTRVEVGVVGAGAVVSGIQGRTEVKGVSGDTTLVGLSGPVRAETVSGSVETQGMTGALRFSSVSGDLTIVDGAGTSVRADSVSGSMIVDLLPVNTGPAGRATDVSVTSVSGEIAVRLPHPADTEVEANTTSGTLSNAFEDLRVTGQWGMKRITGLLGEGQGKLKASTVSGSIALLRRPLAEEPPHETGHARYDRPDEAPGARPDDSGPHDRTGDGPQERPGDGPLDRPGGTETGDSVPRTPSDAGPTDKKVL